MNSSAGPPKPLRLRRRITVLGAAFSAAVRLERRIRTLPLPTLCEQAGISFSGFVKPDVRPDERPLPRAVADYWWATDTVLRWWPWARDRRCLRRALLLGSHISALSPTLVLSITTTQPFGAHAVLYVRGHGLDLGELDGADMTPGPPVDR